MRNNQLAGGSASLASATAINTKEDLNALEIKNTRLEVRTTTDFKEKIRSASAIMGVDMSSFIVLAATELAQKTIEKQRIRLLSEQAWERLNELINAPTIELNDELERLMMEKPRYVAKQ